MAKGITLDLIVDPKKALDGIEKVTGKAEGATKILAGIGGAVAVGATAAIAAVAGVATGLSAASVSAAAYADEILTTATNTNISTEALQAYKYAAELTDVSFETFVKSQGKFTKSMADSARTGTGPAAEAFAALGLSVTDANGNLVDSTQLYWQAIDALANVSNETERTALAQQLFGKSGAEMNSLIAVGSEGFAELAAQAQAAGAIMSGEQLAALGAFDDKLQAMTSTVDAAKNALGLTLLPVLDDLAGSGTSALGEFTSALLAADGDMSKATGAFENLATGIVESLTTAVPKVLEVATSLVSGLIEGIVSQAPSLISSAVPLLVNFVTGILKMLPAILDAGIKVLVALIQGIAQALPQLIPAAVQAVIGLVQALIQNLPLILDAGLQLILGLVQGIVTALPQLIAALPDIIIGIVEFLVNAIPTIIEAGIALFMALIGALPDIIIGIVTAIPQIIIGIQTALINALPLIIDAGIKLFLALITAMPTIVQEIAKATPQIITGIVGAIRSSLPQLIEAGRNLLMGLWDGMVRMRDWLWGKISGFFNNMLGNIKGLLGIHSPSTVFAGFGDNLVLGLEQGLSGPNHLQSIMSDLSSQVTDGFTGSLAASAKATVTTAQSSAALGSGQVVIRVESVAPGAEVGRAIVSAIQEYVRTGGTGLKAVMG